MLLSINFAVIFPCCCCALVLDFVFQPGKVSLVVVSCGFRTETKGKGQFFKHKGFAIHPELLWKSGMCGEEIREETPANGSRKKLFASLPWFSLLQGWPKSLRAEPSHQQNRTYPVINLYTLDICC